MTLTANRPPLGPIIKSEDIDSLKEYVKTLSGSEIADLIAKESTDIQVLIFNIMLPDKSLSAFICLSSHNQKKILSALPHDLKTYILNEMDPDKRTSLLQGLKRKTVEEYLNLLTQKEKDIATTLMGYPENSVGRLMTTDYVEVKMDWTVENVLNHIRDYGHDSETIDMLYVVNDKNVLIDDIKLKDFLFVPKNYKVEQIADKKFIALSVYDKTEKAISIFRKNNRTALPVIDLNGVIRGIVTISNILRLASKKNTAYMQKVGGSEVLDLPYMDASYAELIKKRSRWLVLLFLGEMFTATAMGFFEDEISKAVVLALFLPLIISSGGNSGSQSTTLVIRAMALGEVKVKDWLRTMRRELIVGLCLGIILGVVGFLRISLWSAFTTIYGVHWLLVATTIFLALVGVVLWGSLIGAMLPFLLRRIGWDPATASAPLVATLVDVTGIMIYFTIAMWVLKGTLL